MCINFIPQRINEEDERYKQWYNEYAEYVKIKKQEISNYHKFWKQKFIWYQEEIS